MPLRNCKVVRAGTPDYQSLKEHYKQFSPRRGGNVAFFEIECEGPPPRRQSLRGYDPASASIYYWKERDRWYVIARNVPRSDHSERVCARLFRSFFGSGRRSAKITLVYSEREPCHEGGTKSCEHLLYDLLATQGYGDDGDNTPVRFLVHYKSKAESATAADIGRRDRKRVHEEDRLEGQEASKRVRKV